MSIYLLSALHTVNERVIIVAYQRNCVYSIYANNPWIGKNEPTLLPPESAQEITISLHLRMLSMTISNSESFHI
jgi:hypothetical protein